MRSRYRLAMVIVLSMSIGFATTLPFDGVPVVADGPEGEPVSIECEDAWIVMEEGGQRTMDLSGICHASNGHQLEFEYLGGNSNNLTVELGWGGALTMVSLGDHHNEEGEEMSFRAYLDLSWNISEDFTVLVTIRCNGCGEWAFTNIRPDPALVINIPEGGRMVFSVEVVGVEADPLDLRYAWYVDGKTVHKGTKGFDLQPGYDMAGDHNVKIVVSDMAGEQASFEWLVSVEDTNRRPDIQLRLPLNNTQFSHGDKVVLDILSKDPDGDDIVMRLLDNGKEMKRHRVDGENGTAYLHLKKALAPGKHVIVVNVTDGDLSSTARVEVFIMEPPGRGPPCLGCIVTMNVVAVIYHRLRRDRSRA
jgi:hypothetical protein